MARLTATGSSAWFRLGTLCCVLASLLLVGVSTHTARASGPQRASPTHVPTVTAAARCRNRNRAIGTLSVGLTNPEGFPNRALGVAFQMVQDDLFRHNDQDHLVPMLATKVPTIANGGIRNGGKTIVIHLRRDLHWSNGAEITSSDVKFAWRVFDDPAFDPVNNCGDLCTAILGVTTPDRYTAVMRLTHVDPQWLNETEGSGGFVVPEKWPGFWNNDPHAAALKYLDPSFRPPTTGPYQVVSFDNSMAVLQPMKYYTGLSCGGFLRSITIRVYRSFPALLVAASSRHVDVLPFPIFGPLSQLQSAARSHAFRVHVDQGFHFETLELNHDLTFEGQPNPLHDVRVRLALALAVDKVALQRALGVSPKSAQKLVAWTPWVNSPKLVVPYADRTITGQWDPILHGYVADTGGRRALADARRLLAETPWKRGLTLNFSTSDGRQTEEAAIARDMARIGVHLDAHFVPQGTFTADYDHGGILSRGAFQLAAVSFNSSNFPYDLSFGLESSFIARANRQHAGQNYSGIRDPLIDQAFTQASSTFSHKMQASNFALIQTEINRKAHWIPLFFVADPWTEDGRVANLTWDAALETPLWNPSVWKVKTSRQP